MPYSLGSGILVYRFGERGSGFKTKTGKVLDFHKIKADGTFNRRNLYEDINFPTQDSSIFFSKRLDRPVEWKRPHEIVSDPKFFLGGASRFDVKQGELGNCWFTAAVAILTLNNELFHLVVPEDNGDFGSADYNGTFHFRFWKFGQWVDVVIDDRLPTRNGKLVYMCSVERGEFWSALIEKAYAKQHGSYESLIGGISAEALEDFTGGVTEICKISIEAAATNKTSLFQIMSKAFDRGSFMGCSIDGAPGVVEAKGPMGLIMGHAYSITNVKTIEISPEKLKASGLTGHNCSCIQLLRIRNPWGNNAEWTGDWADGSKKWDLLTPLQKAEFDIQFEADGEFWMSYTDFVKYFQTLDICNLGPDVLDELEATRLKKLEHKATCMKNNLAINAEVYKPKKKWVANVFEGAWIKGVTAGGCPNTLESFSRNPQYLVNLIDPDDQDESKECTLIVALMQKFRRKLGKDFLPIGFKVYRLDDNKINPKPLDVNFFKRHYAVDCPLKYTNLREVSYRFKLNPGTYCIIPSTFYPDKESEFILRVFTETRNKMTENDAEIGLESDEHKTEQVTRQFNHLNKNGTTDSDEIKLKKSVEDEEKLAQEFFKKVAGADMEVNWEELKSLLDSTFKNQFGFQGFSKEICRSMIATMDYNQSGKLDFEEFQILWTSIANWKTVFNRFDVDKSGSLSSFELRFALNSSGFCVNNRVLQALVKRYGNNESCLQFDDFIMCAIKLKSMIEVFKEKVPDGQKFALFSIDDWLNKTLYN